jgi:hypothetical protein
VLQHTETPPNLFKLFAEQAVGDPKRYRESRSRGRDSFLARWDPVPPKQVWQLTFVYPGQRVDSVNAGYDIFPFEIMQPTGGRSECPIVQLSRYADTGFVDIAQAEAEFESSCAEEFAGIGSKARHAAKRSAKAVLNGGKKIGLRVRQ